MVLLFALTAQLASSIGAVVTAIALSTSSVPAAWGFSLRSWTGLCPCAPTPTPASPCRLGFQPPTADPT